MTLDSPGAAAWHQDIAYFQSEAHLDSWRLYVIRTRLANAFFFFAFVFVFVKGTNVIWILPSE